MSALLKRKLDQLKETADERVREEAAETRKRVLRSIGDDSQWREMRDSLVDLEEWKLSLTNLSPVLKEHAYWRAVVVAGLLNKLIHDWSFFPDLCKLTIWMGQKELEFTSYQFLHLVRALVDQRVASGFAEYRKDDVADCLSWMGGSMSRAGRREPFSHNLALILRAFWDHDEWTRDERELLDEFGMHLLRKHAYADLPLSNGEVCFFFTPRKAFQELYTFFLDPESEYQKAKAAEETLALQLAWDAAGSPPVVSDDEDQEDPIEAAEAAEALALEPEFYDALGEDM